MKILVYTKETETNDAKAAKILLGKDHEISLTNNIGEVIFFLRENEKYHDLVLVSGLIDGMIVAAICKPVFSICNLVYYRWKRIPHTTPDILYGLNRVDIEDELLWMDDEGRTFPVKRPKNIAESLEIARLQKEGKLYQVKNWPKFVESALNFQMPVK